MKTGAQMLTLLRQQTGNAMNGWGVVVRGPAMANHYSGRCTIVCRPYQATGVYELNVSQGGLDWIYPFQQDQALSTLIPFGQPNGTLVLTLGMNGCSLEIRQEGGGNRFFHDSDGVNMPVGGGSKFRADYAQYAGNDETALVQSQRHIGPSQNTVGNFEHSLVCVKINNEWIVYSNAVISVTNTNTGEFDAWQIKNRVPCLLGRFPDNMLGTNLGAVQRQARRDWSRNRGLFANNESPF